jgi:exo-beta-1,3-glucanase (GH17 family)
MIFTIELRVPQTKSRKLLQPDRHALLRTQTIAFRKPLALFIASLSIIAAVWWWLGRPVALSSAPIDPAAKLDCVSYAPFRDSQTPFMSGLIISPEQIEADLVQLAKVSRCVRTYSIDNGLDKVPELASRVGLKVILGVWIGRDHAKNALLIDQALSLVKSFPDVITAMMVGNEVLLRGDMTASDLREIIRSVKAHTTIPVSYADVWEFWQRYREVGVDVDFVTIHILPYWEDFPVRAEDAAAHIDDIRKQMAISFPGKEILIGETGWPSRGRMRDVALPSPVNQARFISDVLDRARRENFRVNLFEAYDEPWKRQWEGTVGGYWGLFDRGNDNLKYPSAIAISNHPPWKVQLASGMAFSLCVFAAALWALRRRPSLPRSASWFGVAASATIGGILLGVNAEDVFYESYGLGDWVLRGLLLAAGMAAPILSATALVSKRTVPAFLELIGPSEGRKLSLPSRILGFTLMVTTLIAVETALGLVFDARWRDFRSASLTMAVVPFWTVAWLNRPKSGVRPLAETVFAGLLALAALYVALNEGFSNWQSLWTVAAYLLLGATLLRAHPTPVAETASAMPVVPSEPGSPPATYLVKGAAQPTRRPVSPAIT